MIYSFLGALTPWDWVTSILTILFGMVAIWALIYAKKSADYSKLSLDQLITSKQLEQLQYIHLIIHVQVAITLWKENIVEIAKHIESQDVSWLEKESNILKSTWSNRIIDKYLYEKMPVWLSSIYQSGAQYYYNGKCILRIPANDLIEYWSRDNEIYDIYWIVASLDQLLWYIKNEIPEIFLNTPESINIEDFF